MLNRRPSCLSLVWNLTTKSWPHSWVVKLPWHPQFPTKMHQHEVLSNRCLPHPKIHQGTECVMEDWASCTEILISARKSLDNSEFTEPKPTVSGMCLLLLQVSRSHFWLCVSLTTISLPLRWEQCWANLSWYSTSTGFTCGPFSSLFPSHFA